VTQVFGRHYGAPACRIGLCISRVSRLAVDKS